MASRICLYEAGADDTVELCQANIRTKRILADGSDTWTASETVEAK